MSRLFSGVFSPNPQVVPVREAGASRKPQLLAS